MFEIIKLIDPEVPTRKQLVKSLLQHHPYLSVFGMPQFGISSLSPKLFALQKLILRKKPIRVAGAFASEKYDIGLVKNLYTEMSDGTLNSQ